MHTTTLMVGLAVGVSAQVDFQPLTDADCSTFTDCFSCASASSWAQQGCRWCPLPGDNACHAYGSVHNQCSDSQQITDADTCDAVTATPNQVHIAFRGEEPGTGMAVMWQTVGQTSTSVVRYGLSADDLSFETEGFLESYFDEGSFMHTTVLSGLTPATMYFFQCGDAATGLFSTVHSFTTAWNTPKYPLVSAVFGDMGRAEENAADTIADLTNRSAAGDFDLIWHLGDIGYADDAFLHTPFKFEYEEAYDIYMSEIEPFASQTPLMTLPGNHEAECHSPACQVSDLKRTQLSNFSAYNARFKMPSAESGGSASMWYSFEFPPVHFVSIDTETDFKNAPNDSFTPFTENGGFGTGDWTTWLEEDLASVDRTKTPWLFVGGHRPLYSVKECDEDGTPRGAPSHLQAAVEDLFLKYGVDIYFSGHEHAYERQLPIYRNEADSEYTDTAKPVYIVTGAAGGDESHSDYSHAAQPAWNVIQNTAQFGYGVLTIESESKLTWVQYESATDTVIDSLSLDKIHPEAYG